MKLSPFQSDYGDRDLTLISDTLKQYYPIESQTRLTSETCSSYPGFQKIGNLINSEFIDQKAYKAKWGKLTSHLKKVFKKSVHAYPDLTNGGFFGEVVVSEIKEPDFIRKKSLHFHVSLLGPFFTIYGIDQSTALLSIDGLHGRSHTGNFTATHALTVSPIFEYQEDFRALENELRTFFGSYSFVPYEVGMSTLKNISITDELQDCPMEDTIYEGLFGRLALHSCSTRGDEHYGLNDWTKPLNKEEKSLLDAISRNIINASTDITIHKVWKLKESKRLDSFAVAGNIMFGMELFDVLDLSDKSTAIVVSEKDRGTPSSIEYQISNEVILFSAVYSLKIVDLTQDALTLHLIINFKRNDVSIKGEAIEIKLVAMTHLNKLKA